MAKRRFELPGIQDLSKDQERARALPKEGCHLIVGGPGTGKSIIALLRAKRYHSDNDYVFLVYNRLLNAASRQLIGNNLKSATWHSWLNGAFRKMLNTELPKVEGEGVWKPVDWNAAIERVCSTGDIPKPEFPFVIIDEGQDMPPNFYKTLVNLGFQNFFVVADQNQQITEENSSRRDLEDVLVVNTEEVIELQYNYRNSYPVARLAREFYTDDPASPPPQLPNAGPSVNKPLLVEYGAGCRVDFKDIISRILIRADLEPSKLFGIITPNNIVRDRFFDALRNMEIPLDHGKPKILTSYSGGYGDVLFDEGGILVINAQACKGLEFDVVYIADIHEFHCRPHNADSVKKLFYVMIARARETVVLLKEAGKHCPVDGLLPKADDILGRWR
jgi:DNA helicase II / ATP-dependent DNA helicase PcrA